MPLDGGEVDVRLLPSVGNGHLATNVFSDTIYINGVFNGYLGESHRARVRSLFASDWTIESDQCDDSVKTYRLDMEQAVLEEEISCGDEYRATMRVYAHAQLDRVLVTELSLYWDSEEEATLVREDRSGGESDDDFDWTEADEVDPGVL